MSTLSRREAVAGAAVLGIGALAGAAGASAAKASEEKLGAGGQGQGGSADAGNNAPGGSGTTGGATGGADSANKAAAEPGVSHEATDADGDGDMDTLAFLRSLDYDDGLSVVTAVFQRFPMQYGTTLGLDGSPQIRPLEFKFEQDGALFFDTVDFYESYSEMQAFPQLQVCIGDQGTMSYLRVGGTVNFTRDEALVERCFENSPVLTSQFGDSREHVVAYYLTDAWAEFASFTDGLPNRRYELPNKFDAR